MNICPITKRRVENYSNGKTLSYSVTLSEKTIHFNFCENCFKNIDFSKYRAIIFGLILNNKFNPNDVGIIHWDNDEDINDFDLKKAISESYYPRNPLDKLNNLLLSIEKNQTQIAKAVKIYKSDSSEFISSCYFDNGNEFGKYVEELYNLGFIHRSMTSFDYELEINFKGFQYLSEIKNKGTESKNCFIAMAFDSKTVAAREAIKKAIFKTGFHPIIIDEENIDSDRTINDAIIAGIKNSKFCISDFSYHRNGVYFESGFALGLGKPVIYCCSKDEFSKAHFDIKPLQHIIYESEDDLEKRLIDKIEAWIK